MKRLTPVLIAILALVSASIACNSSTPTPSAADVALTMIGDKVNAEATQAKFESIAQVTAQVAGATATQQAVWSQATQVQQERFDAQATAAKAEANVQATAQQARMDAQATQQRIDTEATQQQARLDLEATVQQSRLDLVATQQASGTATAWSVTQAIIPLHDSWTQQAVQKDILLATNEVELSNLKVKQQQDTNIVQWLVPMLIAIVLTFAGIRYFSNAARVREVKDADGNTDALVIDNEQVIIPRLLPKPVLLLETGEMPDMTDRKEQAEIVKRDQGIRALEVMPERPIDQAIDTYSQMFGGQRDMPFDVIDAEDTPPAGLIDGQSMQSLNKDWKEAKDAE